MSPITPSISAWLLTNIENFLTVNAMDNDGGAFGWVVMQDRSLVQRLRDGGDVTTRKLEIIIAFMQKPVSYDGRLLDLTPIKIKRRTLP